MPTAAGMMKMPTGRFYLANILSAVVWVPALVLSGDLLLQMLGQTAADRMVLAFGAAILALTVAILRVRSRKAVRKANDAPELSAPEWASKDPGLTSSGV